MTRQSLRRLGSLLICVLATIGALHAQSSPIRYVYDELGRLIGVIDSSGESAVYTYDAVGNLLSIARHAAGAVTIIEFTPNSGNVGATVTIFGTGFSATPSQNTLTFNGVAATVTSSTVNQIVTTVPSGATSGPIAVTTPLGSASSSTSFTVTATAPAISSFTPTIGTAGTSVTISGTNFDAISANNHVKFNGQSAVVSSSSTTSIVTTVPAQTGSGRITVATPNGTATGGDFFIPPSPYVAADVSYTGRATLGQAKPVTMTTASKIGLVVFDGTAGQRVSMNVGGVTIPWTLVSITKPDGTTLVSQTWVTTAGKFFDTVTLPVTGSYTVVIDPDSTNTGNMTLTVYNVPADVSGTISAGGSALPLTISTPGQNARITFSGTSGQRISLKLTGVTIAWSLVSITNPDQTTLVAPTWVNTNGGFIDTKTLPANGTYAIVVDPENGNTGNVTLTLYDVPADFSGTVTIGGSGLSLSVTVPGHNPYVTFSGTSGQKIRLEVTGVTIPWHLVSLLKPDGSALISPTWVNTAGYVSATQTLPATGTYKVIVDPDQANTGNATVTVYAVP